MSSLTVDAAYTNLLAHLQRPGSGISLQTVISATPYYLAQLPLPHPTQLTAFVISSSAWQPLSVHTLGSLVNCFRSAVHLKETNLQNSASGWFARDPQILLAEWAFAVMKGVSRGDPQLKIGIIGGLLLGLKDLGHDHVLNRVQDRLENQIVIACAEMLEGVSTLGNSWKAEFKVQEAEDVGGASQT